MENNSNNQKLDNQASLENEEAIALLDVITEEGRHLRLRREKLNITTGDSVTDDWFGIAMSGGGIRSAIINMGILKTFNRFGILEKADYLSTVSGGGYCGAYVQTTIRREQGNYAALFDDKKMKALREHGEYMMPGMGFKKKWNQLMLFVGYFVSTIMSFISPIIVFSMLFLLVSFFNMGISSVLGNFDIQPATHIGHYMLYSIGAVVFLHFLSNIALVFNLDVSKRFNYFENGLLVGTLIFFTGVYLLSFYAAENGHPLSTLNDILLKLAIVVGLFVLGYFANPNAISFHRYYRKQLSDCFMQFAGEWRNIALKDLFNARSERKEDYIAPYPLINTCLNLQAQIPEKTFKGLKSNDFFLLSPLFSGSKLTNYVRNIHYRDYANMTLPAATTISAAAVNPGMGIYSSPILSVLMTIFNARLGFWVSNPLIAKSRRTTPWWPIYFFKELFSNIGLSNRMVNISDGGHIENLAAYELIRRRCRLILCTDGGQDGIFSFSDLENLIVRARNELGVAIEFPKGQEPENLIRPRPSKGYSQKRFAVGRMRLLWTDPKIDGDKCSYKKGDIIGTFVYMKSSVIAPQDKPVLSANPTEEEMLRFGTYKYKIHHPAFPHEPTSDQFFDEVQWESYFRLGQFIGAEVLGLEEDPNNPKFDYEVAPKFSVADLIAHFEQDKDLFETIKERSILSSDIDTPQAGMRYDEGEEPEYFRI